MASDSARLVYVMGPSGAGKDAVLDYARSRCPEAVVFARRLITRPLGAGGEDHVSISPETFRQRLDQGGFALHWEANQTWYGIGLEIDEWLRAGLTVVVSGSRAALPAAAERYPDLRPVLITAREELLRARLVSRGREAPEQIEARLARGRRLEQQGWPGLLRVDNSGPVHLAGDLFLRLLSHAGCPREQSSSARRPRAWQKAPGSYPTSWE